jgi:hypothetical protein
MLDGLRVHGNRHWTSTPGVLARVRQAAKRQEQRCCAALLHRVKGDLLRGEFRSLRSLGIGVGKRPDFSGTKGRPDRDRGPYALCTGTEGPR